MELALGNLTVLEGRAKIFHLKRPAPAQQGRGFTNSVDDMVDAAWAEGCASLGSEGPDSAVRAYSRRLGLQPTSLPASFTGVEADPGTLQALTQSR